MPHRPTINVKAETRGSSQFPEHICLGLFFVVWIICSGDRFRASPLVRRPLVPYSPALFVRRRAQVGLRQYSSYTTRASGCAPNDHGSGATLYCAFPLQPYLDGIDACKLHRIKRGGRGGIPGFSIASLLS